MSETDSVAADDGSIRIEESDASAPQQPFTCETLTSEDETLRSSMDFEAPSPAAISPNATPSGGMMSRDAAKSGNAASNMQETMARFTIVLEVFIFFLDRIYRINRISNNRNFKTTEYTEHTE